MHIKKNKLSVMLLAFPLPGLSNDELDSLILAVCKEQTKRKLKLINNEKQIGKSEAPQSGTDELLF